jgi:hypothetical protein
MSLRGGTCKGNGNNSTIKYVWTSPENTNHPTTGNKTTVVGVVSDKLFCCAKFVDHNTKVMHNEMDGSICNFVGISCTLQAGIHISTWWKQAQKWILTNISWLSNNKSMAIRWAVLVTYCAICDFLRREDELMTEFLNHRITKFILKVVGLINQPLVCVLA